MSCDAVRGVVSWTRGAAWTRGCGEEGVVGVAALMKAVPYCSSTARLAPGLVGGIGLLLQLWSAPLSAHRP